jgi:hypothetical protein
MPPKYTAEILAPIVASATSLSDVMRKLGLEPNGGNHRLIQARIRIAGLDTSHFGARTLRARVDALPHERLVELTRSSRTIAEVLAKLDMPTHGRCHREMTRRLRELAIDTSQFQGQGWSRGLTRKTHPSVDRYVRKREFPDEAVFVANGPVTNGPRLLRRLLAMGWEYRCAICGISEWCGQRLVLHVDHINGINNDNRVENLRLLCPNCHSQTPTYCNRARETAACYTWIARERGGTG